MRNFYHLMFLATAVLLGTGCNKDDDGNGRRCNITPCPSTFTALVDGVRFEPERGSSICRGYDSYYYPEGGVNVEPGFLSLRAQDCPDTLSMNFWIASVYGPSTFDIVDTSNYFLWKYPSKPSPVQTHKYDIPIAGQIKLTHIQPDSYEYEDSKWGRAQGTFWATLHNGYGDTVRITEGKFDMFLRTF